ncbi:hypothetical protein BH789_gp089 [Gordonia phage GMA6]|uniref:HNH nuclease domain-containing protein n=1 Tax=Gordonia phage GMA6 TaxID=1647285 RepID=A0A0K0NKV9_9CAUD|nr:hypothetical protein BH789_gp089 [Gordonia phage GMA6]AKL88370.1 hypothetical protein GMA6_89 [Gordonia phage GMA6]
MPLTKKRSMSSKKPASRIRSLAGISKVSSSQQLVKAKKRAMSLPLRKRESRSSALYDEQVIVRLLQRSEVDGDCLILPSSINDNGYATCSYHRKTWSVHRLSYTLFVGAIPDGLHIDHLKGVCSNRNCWAPSHLEAVTQTENNNRTRRDRCKSGHLLTDDNLIVEKGGNRRCKTCRTKWQKSYK